jgi:hypothetical protein
VTCNYLKFYFYKDQYIKPAVKVFIDCIFYDTYIKKLIKNTSINNFSVVAIDYKLIVSFEFGTRFESCSRSNRISFNPKLNNIRPLIFTM